MKPITSLSFILLTATLLSDFSTHAEQIINFKPPQLGAPVTRIGGGTRGISSLKKSATTIQLLAPKQVGLSSSATPTLYWYLPKSSSDTVRLTVQQGEDRVLLDKNIGAIKTAGIQAINLANYSLSLEAGQDYTWTISLESDAEQDSNNIFASAVIRYTIPTTPLTDATKMAEAGYWYDTVNQLVTTQSPQLTAFLQHEGIYINTGK